MGIVNVHELGSKLFSQDHRGYYENQSIIFLVNSLTGKIEFVSNSVFNYLDYTALFYSNLKSFWEIVKTDCPPFVDSHEVSGFLQRDKKRIELLNSKGKSSLFFCEVITSPVLKEGKGIVELHLFPKRVKTSTPEVEKRICEIVDAIKNQIPVFTNNGLDALFISENGICIGQNDAARKVFGYSDSEIIGMTGETLVEPTYLDLVQQNFANGIATPYEIKMITKGGVTFYAEIQGKDIDYRGNVVRVSALKDIDERKKAELIIQEHKINLKKSNEALHSKTLFLEAINEFIIQLHAVHTVPELYQVLLDLLEKKFDFEDCIIFKFHPETEKLIEHSRKQNNRNKEPYVISNFVGIVGACAKDRKPVLVRDIELDSRYVNDGANGSSELSVPLLINNQLYGVIDSEHSKKDYYTTEHIEVMVTIASIASERIKNIESEIQLKESELKHRLIFEKAQDAIFLSKNNIWVDCNQMAVDMFGCSSKKELLGQNPFVFSPVIQPSGKLSKEVGLQLKINAAAGDSQYFDWVHTKLDGTPFYAEVSLNRFELNGENFIQSIVRDVSKAYGLNQNIRKNSELYRTLLDLTSSVAWEYDLSAEKYNYISPQIKSISGYTRSEWQVIRFWDNIIHPDDRDRVIKFSQYNIALKRDYNHKYRIIRKDGSIGWLHDVVTVMYENEHSITLRGCFLDITAQKRTEKIKREFTEALQTKVNELQIAKHNFEEIFEESRIALLQDDLTEFIKSVKILIDNGVSFEQMVSDHMVDFRVCLSKIKLVKLNKAAVNLFQASNKKELNSRIKEILTNHTRMAFVQVVKQIFEGQIEFKIQTELNGLKGREITGEAELFVKVDPNTNRTICHTSIVDVTDRVLNEIELARHNNSLQLLSKQLTEKNGRLVDSEARLEALFQDNPVPMWEEDISQMLLELDDVKDSVLHFDQYMVEHPAFLAKCLFGIKILRANKAGLKLFGAKDTSELRKLLFKAFESNEGRIAKFQIISTLNGENSYTTHYPFVNSKNETVSAIVKFVRIVNTNRVIISLVDVTELKKIETELIIAKLKAEESDRLKTEFLNNLSHEIRTPLNGVIGFSSLLADPNLKSQEIKEYIKIITNSGNQLVRIIDEIIEISQIQTNQIPSIKVQVSINQLCDDLYSVFDIQAKEKGLKLTLRKPLSDTDSVILIDKTKLHKILSNLVQNAIKFTSIGEVSFGYDLVKNQLKFFVQDTGIGIEKGKLDVIFQKFVQGNENIAADYGGLGLGLSIVKEHIELLNGNVKVSSNLNQGALFEVILPFHPVYDLPEITMKLNKFKTTEKCMVLVVEDDEVNTMYLIKTLNKIGVNCQIVHAKNGQEAVEICEMNREFTLIFMDIGMPVMNGYNATIEIKRMYPNVPIVAQTAYASLEDREKMKKVGMDDFLVKPIERMDLIKVLTKYFELAPSE